MRKKTKRDDWMAQREKLEEAIRSLEEYRKSSMCKYCKEYADITIDTLRALADIDMNLEAALRARVDHPGIMEMPKLNSEVRQLRRKSEEMLPWYGNGQQIERENEVAGSGTATRAGPLRNSPLGMRPLVRDTGNSLIGVVNSIRPVNIFSQWRNAGVRQRGTKNKSSQ